MTPINGNGEKTPKLHSQFPHFLCVCCYCSCIVRFFAVSLFVFSFRPLERNILSCGLAYSFGFSLFSHMELNMK